MKSTTFVILAALALGGCVSTLTDDRIREETGAALGVSSDELTIRNVRHEMTNTFYVARTRSGEEYSCILNGGNVMTFGMTNPAICRRVAR